MPHMDSFLQYYIILLKNVICEIKLDLNMFQSQNKLDIQTVKNQETSDIEENMKEKKPDKWILLSMV